MRFGYVPDPDWATVRDFLLPAIEMGGEFTEQEVREAIEQGEAQLWIARDDAIRVAVITKIRRGGRVCEIWLIGGENPGSWLHFLQVIETAARERGCGKMELIGRVGWERLLPDYRRTAIVLEKAL